MRQDDVQPRAIRISSHRAKGASEEIPARGRNVKQLWIPFRDELYLASFLSLPVAARKQGRF